MAIETLAAAIRTNPDVKGVSYGGQEHKCALYADDLLLFVTSPLTLASMIYKILGNFSVVSGLEVNMSSIALNITVPPDLLTQISNNFDFTWATSEMPYLGNKIIPDIESLFKANFPPILQRCRGDLGRWARCDLSWLGRVYAVKMTLLPRVLYLFRSLPILIGKQVLSKFQSEIVRFVWGRKGYRCLFKTLHWLKSQGGLGLPDLWGYYQAAQLSQISAVFSKGPKPDRLSMER